MSKMTEESSYHDGDIVWVKMNKLWWPGEVHESHRLPSDFFEQFRKPPLVVVKFFQEENYHCVNQLHQVAQFNCVKKKEFIKKGLDLYYAKHSYMEEFPGDVAIAEKKTGGNPNIIYSKEFMPTTKPDKTSAASTSKGTTSRSRRGQQSQQNALPIPRVMIKPDHDTRILVPSAPTPSNSSTASSVADNKYKCTLCNYSTNRINTFVWHQKTHSSAKTPPASTSQRNLTNETFTPSTSRIGLREVKLQYEDEKNVSEEDTDVTQKVVEPIDLDESTEKAKANRLRQRGETRSQSVEKATKTDNKLKRILDDWSDDEMLEAGPSGSTNQNCEVNVDDDEMQPEGSVKKKFKFDNDNGSEGVEKKTLDVMCESFRSSTSVDGNKGQIEQLQTTDETIDEVKPQTRLRSGKSAATNENITVTTPKRRGKRSRHDTEDMKESEIDSTLLTNEVSIDAPSTEHISEESTVPAIPAPVQIKSNSKTSRKGKPRRKEEIKLANNVSVAVLVEKTNLSPRTHKESEQKVVLPVEENEYANVAHKKIRYMSRGSTDDLQKMLDPKLSETNTETSERSDVGSGNCEKTDTNADSKTDRAINIFEVSSTEPVHTTNDSNLEKKELDEKMFENSKEIESSNEQHFTQKYYRRNSTSKTLTSDASASTSIDHDELPSSSNLRQRSQKRYENTRNRRKSGRRTTSDDDFSTVLEDTDDNYEKNDRVRQKSVDLNKSLNEGTATTRDNDSGKEIDQSSENSNSKTSTPEKADNSKELDCFDFTEDECAPQVLNRRKRLPPVKVFELEDIGKIEEQRRIDEESARRAQKRDEDNAKLHAELENLLNSTTPVALPEIPTGHKVHENFPERRAEKDPEKNLSKDSDIKDRMLPPKERNKRIFKYRNRNRRSDSDGKMVTGSCDLEDTKGHCDESLVVGNIDETEVVQQKQSDDRESATDKDKKDKNLSAHDLKIEIAETLINFPLLSPKTDGNEQHIDIKLSTTKPQVKCTPKLRNEATVTTTTPEIIPIVGREETAILTNESTENTPTGQSMTSLSNNSTPNASLATNPNNYSFPEASNIVRDFKKARIIETTDNHTTDGSPKTHPLPLKKSVVLTQTESNSFITRIPKKRKSQMGDNIPAFVIEKPKDHSDDVSELNNQLSTITKETKPLVVTKTIKKQVTGEVRLIAGGVIQPNPNERNESVNAKDSQQERNYTQLVNPASEEISSIESPVIMSSHLINQKVPVAKNAQKRASVASSVANVLSSLSANRPCTIAPAKKPSYRRPTDMTGLTQKQIGTDGKGNPVMIYTEITPPTNSQATTFTVKRNEPIPSTSQIVKTFSTSLQSNQGNQFVITSMGALITNKPFTTTTHPTPPNQPTLTNRQNIQVHTQLIRSPNTQLFQTQQQQHLPSQSNQIIVQNTLTNLSPQIPPIASGMKQLAPQRNVPSKVKPFEADERLTKSFALDEGNTTFKKRIVRRISKSQASSSTIQQQQKDVSSEVQMPPLIPINEPLAPRKPIAKQQMTPMTFIQEQQVHTKAATHVDVGVEPHQENMQEILALPGDTPGFGGPPGSYFLCKLNEMGVYIPIDHQPLYLDVTDNTNLLKPNAPDEVVSEMKTEIPQQSPVLFGLNNEAERVVAANQTVLADPDANNPKYLINISDGQQLLVDQQSLMALANGEEFPQFVTPDGQQIILQSGQHDILSAIAFAEDVGLIA
ncbi:hypothetical protein Bhyg_15883, partial [Pseudolycoriella hygida]